MAKRLGIASLVIAGLVGAGGIAFASFYASELRANRSWLDQVQINRSSFSSQSLFEQAHAARLITFDVPNRRIVTRECEAQFAALAGPAATDAAPLEPGHLSLLRRLCTTGTGREILNEIEQWNASFEMLAVRDHRPGRQVCDDGSAPTVSFVPVGCRANRWTAEIEIAPGVRAPFSALPGQQPPYREYAALAAELEAWASDWAVYPPAGDRPVVLSTRIPADQRRVLVNLIGQPSRIWIGTQSGVIRPDVTQQDVRVGNTNVRVDLVCDDNQVDGGCTYARSEQAPHAYWLTLTIAGREAVNVAVELRPVRNFAPNARRVLGTERLTTERSVRLKRSAHIEVACSRHTGDANCTMNWETAASAEPLQSAGYRIVLRDGRTEVTDRAGRITQAAIDMGLAPVIGFGVEDNGSLTAAMRSGGGREERTLTLPIDAEAQRLATLLLAQTMAPRVRADSRARGAIVLMDADQRPGEIVAVTSWPAFIRGLHVWDHLALAAGSERESPLSGHAWRAGDVHAMPGSTFKTVTAIAGMNAALRGDNTAADIVLGRIAPDRIARLLTLSSAGDSTLDVQLFNTQQRHSLRNSHGAAFNSHVRAPQQSGCPRGDPRIAAQIGVCEASIVSSNLYFGGLAMYLDQNNLLVNGRERTDYARNLVLAETTRHLFALHEPEPAQRGEGNADIDMTGGLLPGAYRLRAETIRLAAVEERTGPRRLALATNGFGQGVGASAVAMTSIYASVVLNRVVHPRIVRSIEPGNHVPAAETPRPLFMPVQGRVPQPELAERMRQALIAGLHGVPRPGGTANAAFAQNRPLADRVSGKTGTADTAEGYNSVWFVGWVEPGTGGIRRRLAFGCWLTHARDFGGSGCGPVIRQLLEQIDRGARIE